MRKARLIGLCFGCALALLIAILALSHDKEPRYHGKSLSQWLVAYEKPTAKLRATYPMQPEAINAVHQIGTNAIPWVIRWMRMDRNPAKTKLRAVFEKLPPIISDSSTINSWLADHREFPLVWFEMLRRDAAPAIPELVRVINDPSCSKRTREVALNALTFIGQDTVPVFMEIISSGSPADRDLAIFYLAEMRGLGNNSPFGNGRVLIQCLQDTNVTVAARAADALATCRVDPLYAVSALTNALHDSRQRVRAVAAYSLGRFGEDARAAVPELQAALGDGDFFTRQAATNALRRIAPETINAEAQR